MLKCQKCGAQNNEESVHCCLCGEKLDKGIICSKCCCVRIPNDALFCPTCGKSLEEEFFNIANNVNTIEAYVEFQNKFKTGVFVHKASEIISELNDVKFERSKEKIIKIRWVNTFIFIGLVIVYFVFLCGIGISINFALFFYILICILGCIPGILDMIEYKRYKKFGRFYNYEDSFFSLRLVSLSIIYALMLSVLCDDVEYNYGYSEAFRCGMFSMVLLMLPITFRMVVVSRLKNLD